MSKQIEFSTGASANGAEGIYIHVRRDDPDFIAAIHAAAIQTKRVDLAKQIERYAGSRVIFASSPEKLAKDIAAEESAHQKKLDAEHAAEKVKADKEQATADAELAAKAKHDLAEKKAAEKITSPAVATVAAPVAAKA